VGTNFRLPNAVPATGPIHAPQQKTLSVKFQGYDSEWAYPASTSLILARVPEWRGAYDITFPAALDVRVANLDDSEVEIPGENATRADCYTISRPDCTAESHLERVLRELISLYRRHMMQNTHHTTQRDYSLTPALQETLRASGPLLRIHGPRVLLNRFYSLNKEEDEADALGGAKGRMRRKPEVTVDLSIGEAIWANNPFHLSALVQGLLLFHRDIKYVRVAVDPADPSKGEKAYEFEPEWGEFPNMDTEPSADDLVVSVSRCVVRGVQVDTDFGTIVERGWIVDDSVLQAQTP
ncbi:MAG: hypothetical protein ABFD77_05985, partial [Thermotogota bacterium]